MFFKSKKAWIIHDWLLMIAGVVIVAVSYRLFYLTNSIVPGGVTGISSILHYSTGTPIGLLTIAFNIPIFIVGFRSIGLQYCIRSLFCMTLMSVLIDVLPIGGITDNLLLASVFGGALSGLGYGLVFHAFSSTGGVDIVAKVVNKYRPHLSLARVIFLFDLVVISVGGFFVGIEPALYAIIGVFITEKATDYVIDGVRAARAYYVVSDNYKDIAEKVMTQIERGATLIDVTGMYSGRRLGMLLCVIRPHEVGSFIRIVRETDSKAFVFVTDIHEVMGEGFGRLEE
ncbi:MAG: YitT family protein [Eubacteriales bacterium]|nr:YitT family protein [Eubacteriales bacterium]